MDTSVYSERKLHEQFVNGGVERAAEKLAELERSSVHILAFSIGGAIGWKFGIISNKIDSLFCISSTRLRNEINKPNGNIHLYFGEDDGFRPHSDWYQRMKLTPQIFKDRSHQMYMEPEIAKQICKQVIQHTRNHGIIHFIR